MGLSSIKLFRLFGIDVFLHWSWFIAAVFIIPSFNMFDGLIWKVGIFVSLFAIVLIHEFGHALACKSVGGRSERIMLWPLGGVAFVQPPQRPGAVLWSIVAGPLVNVILVPITLVAYVAVAGWTTSPVGDLQTFLGTLVLLNGMLLIFNMLPIYPLDGGQILMSLLWFAIGRAKAMQVAGVIGLIGAGLGVVIAILTGNIMLMLIAFFGAFQAWIGFRAGSAMSVANPAHFDERLAKKQGEESVDQKIQGELDPWR